MRIFLIGKGGREHALAWKLAQSSQVEHVFVVPGNGGTAQGIAKVSNLPAAKGYPGLVAQAKEHKVDLAVVGPDDEVVGGIEAHFREGGIPCFAPSKEAAIMEGSKTFAKDFMKRHNIPTARYQNFTNYEEARKYLESCDYRVVIKASGLAAGKGVKLPVNQEEAQTNLKEIMLSRAFGSAGDDVVIEEYLEGDEISLLTLSDGITHKTLSPAQDHKRALDGDQGPNTGGMGVFAPSVTPDVVKQLDEQVLIPTFAGLKAEGRTFKGLLFTGLMLTPNGPRVLEYNARFGDPESQSVLRLLTDYTDFAAVLLACTQGTLQNAHIGIKEGKFACNVVVTAGGYPGSYAKGNEVQIGALPEDTIVFHAGTKLDDGKLKTDGGRVFAISALGDTLKDAVAKAYEGVGAIKFENMFFRKDIAHRSLT